MVSVTDAEKEQSDDQSKERSHPPRTIEELLNALGEGEKTGDWPKPSQDYSIVNTIRSWFQRLGEGVQTKLADLKTNANVPGAVSVVEQLIEERKLNGVIWAGEQGTNLAMQNVVSTLKALGFLSQDYECQTPFFRETPNRNPNTDLLEALGCNPDQPDEIIPADPRAEQHLERRIYKAPAPYHGFSLLLKFSTADIKNPFQVYSPADFEGNYPMMTDIGFDFGPTWLIQAATQPTPTKIT